MGVFVSFSFTVESSSWHSADQMTLWGTPSEWRRTNVQLQSWNPYCTSGKSHLTTQMTRYPSWSGVSVQYGSFLHSSHPWYMHHWVTVWSRNSKLSDANWHMVGLAIKPTSASRFKRLERFRHDQDMSMKFLISGWLTWFNSILIILVNTQGAFLNPNGRTLNSYCSFYVMKTRYDRTSLVTGVW